MHDKNKAKEGGGVKSLHSMSGMPGGLHEATVMNAQQDAEGDAEQ